jgi:hypothetical protein
MKSYPITISRRFCLAAGCILAALTAPSSRADVTITGLVDTPTNLSFNFSGTEFGADFISGPLFGLVSWEIGGENQVFQTQGFGFSLEVKHLPDGPFVTLGSVSPLTTYGSTLFSEQTTAHGAGFDHYSMNITVAAPFGPFFGSISGVHRSAGGPEGVPDGGSTIVLLASGFLALVGLRRRIFT